MAMKYLGVLILPVLLAGGATAPPQPTSAMRPVEAYPNLDCQGLSDETLHVSEWEKYHADHEAYQQSNASFSDVMLGLGSMMEAVAGQYDAQSAAQIRQTNLDTANVKRMEQAAASGAATQRDGMTNRRVVLQKMMQLKKCGSTVASGA
ncbi:MAG TPA: hypothetical protein VF050_04100 [Moraxellaceae bacterium]